MSKQKYLHGYTERERQRLLSQSDFLESMLYQNIDFSKCTHVLEVGCGVGAHLKLLLKKYPNLKVTGIDIDGSQIEKAGHNLHAFQGRFQLIVGDASELHLNPKELPDGALFTWVLEHVNHPIDILKAVKNNLQPNSPIYLSEVYNRGWYIQPSLPNITRYWQAYNRLQDESGGDTVAGVKLGYHLTVAGFKNIEVRQIAQFHDLRDPIKRIIMANYLYDLLLSGSEQLLEAGYVTQDIIDEMTLEFEQLKTRDDAIIFYPGFQASAIS
ncbi:MAG: class I SAM-dependent methyltransferase [Bacteroidetes bacterium]|nr:class I SAM-dependent methyltransferase [Bacteroidota bacterium]